MFQVKTIQLATEAISQDFEALRIGFQFKRPKRYSLSKMAGKEKPPSLSGGQTDQLLDSPK